MHRQPRCLYSASISRDDRVHPVVIHIAVEDFLPVSPREPHITPRRRARLIVWCLDCRRQIEPDPAEMAEHYGTEMPVSDWHERLVCSRRGSRRIDFVITDERRDG